MIEVWGRQKDVTPGESDLNTKELMAREKTIITGGGSNQVGQRSFQRSRSCI